jgi:hypothetical protein
MKTKKFVPLTKGSHSPSVKTVYAKLDNREPFNEIERAQFDERERALIRGIQLRDKEDKQQAIQTYTNYQIEGRRATKALASSVRNYVKEKYPKVGGTISHEVTDFEKPKKKTEVRRENKKDVFKFLSARKNYTNNPKVYTRVQKGSKKYPNASVQELRHGVNSQWSQNYRAKHGLTRDYI